MNFLEITNKPIPSTLEIASSKSYANRALICGALEKRVCTIKNLTFSTDVTEMIEALRTVGLIIEQDKDQVIIKNSFPACEFNIDEICEVKTGEGGTTNRFLMSLLSLGQRKYKLIPNERFLKRPNHELLRCLKKLGGRITQDDLYITLKGPLFLNQKIEVDCSDSSQFASSLFLIARKINLDISLLNLRASSRYIEMSKHVLESFEKKLEYFVPIDFSSLSYYAAYAAVTSQIQITNCYEIDQNQGDSLLLTILKECGAIVEFNSKGLFIAKSRMELQTFDVDCSECLDLALTLVFLGSVIKGSCYLRNIQNLRFKESNRLKESLRLLDLFGVEHFYNISNDFLEIKGQIQSGKYQLCLTEDHRIIMSSTLFLKYIGGGLLNHFDSVKKSNPNFFNFFI